jgi:DNA polymerase-3 subunit epsilon
VLECLTVIDFETTGLAPDTHFVTEIAAARIRNGEVTSTFSTLVDFGGTVSAEITEHTGITTEMCQRGKEPRHSFALLRNFIGTDTIIAHNAGFDVAFLRRSYERYGSKYPLENPFLCTVLLAQQVLGEIPSYGTAKSGKPLGPHQLENLRLHYNIETGKAHRALADVEATAKLVQLLFEQAETNCEGWLGPDGAEEVIRRQFINRYPAPYVPGRRASYAPWLPAYAQQFEKEVQL